jgi:short subunit dehydrogenase-like uncharacterized protein
MSNPSSRLPVLVYGAAGHTARFVVQSLRERGHAVLPGGRNEASLRQAFPEAEAAEFSVFPLNDPGAAEAELRRASLVVNCAGPFADTTEQLLQAAIAAGRHYIDIAAEQAMARIVLEAWNERAKAAGIVAVPAMGFYGGLGDLLATAAMDDWAEADEIALYIALDSWHPTAGTRKTVTRNAGRHLVFSDGRLTHPPETSPRTRWRFADAFGEQAMEGLSSADVVTISSHLQARNIPGWINTAPIAELVDPKTPPPAAVDALGRSAQRFTVEAVVTRGGIERRASASGQDIYAVTGPLVAEAATRILAPRKPLGHGSFAAGNLFDAKEFLRALAPASISLKLA